MANDISLGKRLSIVGKELAMGNIGNAGRALLNPANYAINSSDYRGDANGSGMWLFERSGQDIWFSYSGLSSAVKAYTSCPPLTAIINRKAGAYATGKNWILTVNGKGKGKESYSAAAEKLRALMAKPNPIQSWKQFEAQAYIYQQLFGYCVILPIKPAGFPNIDASALWIIPPQMCEIVENREFWYRDKVEVIKQIKLTYKSQTTYLNPKDVFILKDFTPSFDSQIIPDSRIKALEQPINNIRAAFNARGSLIDDRGALGMISSDQSDDSGNIPMKGKEKEDVQNEFSKFGIRKGQFKYIITTAALKWTSIGYSTKDLMLFEEIEDDTDRLHDAYGTNKRLFNNNRNNSLGGTDAAEFNKQFYQNIKQESESIYEQWNQFFNTAAYNIKLDKDFSEVPALQEDEVKKATARFNRNKALEIEFRYDLLTKNRWLELNGEDPMGAEGEVYYSDIKDLIGNPAASNGGLNDQNGNNSNNDNSTTQNNGN